MVKSMTAYGRAAGEADGRHYLVEMKSVNNRFLDLTVKLPRSYGYLEEKIITGDQQRCAARDSNTE